MNDNKNTQDTEKSFTQHRDIIHMIIIYNHVTLYTNKKILKLDFYMKIKKDKFFTLLVVFIHSCFIQTFYL